MIGLVDNDIFYKLSCCSLLDESGQYLQFKKRLVLKEVKFVIGKRKFKSGKGYGHDLPSIQARFKNDYEQSSFLPAATQAELLIALMESGIDDGEAQLLCYALETGGTVLLSGDKRFYSSLINNPKWVALCKGLKGRMICLEHLLLCLIEQFGFSYVSERVYPARECDGALKQAFSTTNYTNEKVVTEALVSFSKEVVAGLGDLCHEHQPWYK